MFTYRAVLEDFPHSNHTTIKVSGTQMHLRGVDLWPKCHCTDGETGQKTWDLPVPKAGVGLSLKYPDLLLLLI